MRRLLSIFVMLLCCGLTSAAPKVWMGAGSPSNNSTVYYFNILGRTSGLAVVSKANRYFLLSGPGTVNSLTVWTTADPGSGNEWKFTLYKNGSATTMTATVGSGATTAEDTTHTFTFVATDTLVMEIDPGGTPNLSTTCPLCWCLEYTPGTGYEDYTYISGCSDTSLATTATYAPVGQMYSQSTSRLSMPVKATVRSVYVSLATAPGTDNGRTFTVWKGGSASNPAMAFTISDSATSGNTSTNQVGVDAGDYIDVRTTVAAGSPTTTASVLVGMALEVDATATGKFPLFHTNGTGDLSTTVPSYMYIMSQGAKSDTESDEYMKSSVDLTLSAIYVKLSGTPGADASYTFMVRESAGDTSPALTCSVADALTTGSGTLSPGVTIEAGNTMDIQSTPSVSPAPTARRVCVGILASAVTETEPTKAVLGSPAPTGVTGVGQDVDVTWTADTVNATGIDVYFDKTTNPPTTKVLSNVSPSTSTYDPGTMDLGGNYFWRVDSLWSGTTVTGDVWSFTVTSGENSFGTDGDCVALWRFDTVGDLGDDTKGSNDLSNVGATADTSVKKQGTTAARFTASEDDYMDLGDGTLAAGYPFKVGDTNKKCSVSLWFRASNLPSSPSGRAYLYSKWYAGDGKRTFAVALTAPSSTYVTMLLGYNSGASEEVKTNTDVAISIDTWYYAAVTYDDSTKRYSICVSDGSIAHEMDGTTTNNISVTSAAVYLGAAQGDTATDFDGRLDEVAVFKDILTSVETYEIGAFDYDGPASTGSGGIPPFRSILQ